MTDNELIAEFMGWKRFAIVKKGPGRWDYVYSQTDSFDGDDVSFIAWHHPTLTGYQSSNFFEYHRSWEALMPVIEAIYNWGSKRADYGYMARPYRHLNDLSVMADFKQAYDSVVEFVKWYKEQPK